MLSRLALRNGVSLRISSRTSYLAIARVPLVARCLTTSPANEGKNIYYGYSQQKNQQPNSRGHWIYYSWLVGIMTLIMFKGHDFIEWMGLDASGREIDKIGEKMTPESLSEDGELAVGKKKKKKKTSFREKKIMEYENRIRNYSTPDKIFRYFATLKVKRKDGDGSDIYMTPEDFVRSLMPGSLQPEEYGLDRFRRFDPDDCKMNLRENSIFYHLEKHGLISFSDYILLLTLLSTPPKQFELAFKMFDDNGDGNLDRDEYEKVQAIIRSRTPAGQRHRDHANTGNVIKTDPDGALSKYFFGDNLDQKVSHQKFLQFHKEIHDEILWIEFYDLAEKEGDADTISERDFANQLLLYAGISDQKRVSVCKRVRKEFKTKNQGITFKEYYDFAQVLKSINEIDTALTFYHVAGAAIDKTTLKHVAKTVAKVQLTDHLVDVVFAIFDDNDDERLSNKEFVAVMKRRLMRGLERPKETGFTKLFTAISACSKSMASDTWDKWTAGSSSVP